MDTLTRLYVRLSSRKGQTMGEYALILASVAVVAFAAYRILGQDIQQLVNSVGADL